MTIYSLDVLLFLFGTSLLFHLGDLFSEAVSTEQGRTSGTQLTGEGETTCTGEHSVGELL